jgi:Tol biopolymer transport system component
MKRVVIHTVTALIAIGIIACTVFYFTYEGRDDILAAYFKDMSCSGITIEYPFNGTVFPPELVSPLIRWKDETDANMWVIYAENSSWRICLCPHTSEQTFRPSPEEWEDIKKQSLEKDTSLIILGVRASQSIELLSGAHITFRTSQNRVGAPIFYRDVKPPFKQATQQLPDIRWRFGTVSSAVQPPVVMAGLPVCANCHSFSADGKTLGMDIDYNNDKGAYAIASVKKNITFSSKNIISWSDYKREEHEPTFGLLSAVSPDGKYVVSTVKDQSLSILGSEVRFSLRFFPIKGILAVYDRETEQFFALPGADDPAYVQSNPVWSPDGKTIVFTRTRARRPRKEIEGADTVFLIITEQGKRSVFGSEPVQFDLYQIPFNNGKGSKAVPVKGASNNGMSNYFPKFSPDGRWIVFCRAKEGMLLEPDSELYIIPSTGGTARRMKCNLPGMNSWHSWSPNSRWLVFASKAFSDYTQLFLTHIDEQGRSTPPVVLDNFNGPERAANIPEFVNGPAEAIKRIANEVEIPETQY